jgi:hypothetical protein
MPKLVWVEKQYVVNQADDESFRLLRRVPGFSNPTSNPPSESCRIS